MEQLRLILIEGVHYMVCAENYRDIFPKTDKTYLDLRQNYLKFYQELSDEDRQTFIDWYNKEGSMPKEPIQKNIIDRDVQTLEKIGEILDKNPDRIIDAIGASGKFYINTFKYAERNAIVRLFLILDLEERKQFVKYFRDVASQHLEIENPGQCSKVLSARWISDPTSPRT